MVYYCGSCLLNVLNKGDKKFSKTSFLYILKMYDLYTSIHLMCKYLIYINIHCDVNSIHKKICVFYGESVS